MRGLHFLLGRKPLCGKLFPGLMLHRYWPIMLCTSYHVCPGTTSFRKYAVAGVVQPVPHEGSENRLGHEYSRHRASARRSIMYLLEIWNELSACQSFWKRSDKVTLLAPGVRGPGKRAASDQWVRKRVYAGHGGTALQVGAGAQRCCY